MTDGGQLIRCPVTDIRKARRRTQGVRLFNIPEGARVVQVSHLADANGANGTHDEETDGEEGEAPEGGLEEAAAAGDAGEQE